jgi:membrane associated rhomboid family serine protease
MPGNEPQPSEAPPPARHGLVEVGRYASEREAADHGLVVLAMRLGYWIEPAPAGYSLWVSAVSADDVRVQLALFDRESANWPPRLRPLARLRFSWGWPLAWALATIAVYRLQLRWPGRLEVWGALQADAAFGAGEVWRPFTALFLHADLGHLVANLGAGVFLFGLVLGGLGARRGGLALATVAVAGNIAAAALHPWSGYSSIGASTAIFAALGLLTGAAVRDVLRRGMPFSWRALLLPLLAGGSLLALHGSGGLRTDVVAHATGFSAGLLLGVFMRPARVPAP